MSEHGPRDPVTVAFVCVQNAGRSQMATAFAESERAARGLADAVEILTGGTRPADSVHDVVVEAMNDVDGGAVDLSNRTPREITTAELGSADYVATMGCSTLELDAGSDGSNGGAGGDDGDGDGPVVRDWALDDPDGEDPERVREIRNEVRDRVRSLFDEIERDLKTRDGEAVIDE